MGINPPSNMVPEGGPKVVLMLGGLLGLMGAPRATAEPGAMS